MFVLLKGTVKEIVPQPMSLGCEDLRLSIAELGDTELEAFAIAVEQEINYRRDDQKSIDKNSSFAFLEKKVENRINT